MRGGSRESSEGIELSIITVCYNSEATIAETIKSLSTQTDKRYELIIVDGGSTDRTLEILKEYDQGINFWMSEPDKGIYDAMNQGLKHAKGNFISFLNSDDIYFPNTIAEVLQAFENNNADLVYGNIQKIREIDGKLYYRTEKPNLDLMPQTMGVFHPATFAKKSVYDSIGNFNLNYKLAADYDWVLRVYLQGFNWKYIDSNLAGFKIGGASNNSCLSYKEAIEIQEIHKTGHSEEMKKLYLLCQKKMRKRRLIAIFVKLPLIKKFYSKYLISKWSV